MTPFAKRPDGIFQGWAWGAIRCRRRSTSISATGCVSCKCRCGSVRLERLGQPAPCRCVSTARRRRSKPKKNAAPEMQAAYKEEKKLRALPLAGLAAIGSVRQSLDERPETAQRQLIVSGDGSYTNKSVLRHLPPRPTFIGRIRKDAKLHLPLPERDGAVGRPRLYGPQAPTPEQILEDDSIPVVKILCFAAGALREIPVKVYGPVYWRKAGVDVPLLLVVIKPLGYRLRIGSKLLYRQPAFLVCTDVHLDLQLLVQSYIQRWEIECNHRDEKSLLGVAQGQVRSPLAVSRLPQFQVAAYRSEEH